MPLRRVYLSVSLAAVLSLAACADQVSGHATRGVNSFPSAPVSRAPVSSAPVSSAPVSSQPAAPSSQTVPSTQAAPSSGSSDLEAKALTISDLPAGWSVDDSDGDDGSDNSDNGPICFRPVTAAEQDASDSQDVEFVKGSSDTAPDFEERLNEYADATQAAQEFASMTAGLASCGGKFTDPDDTTFHGTIHPLTFASMGQQAKAYQLALKQSGEAFYSDVALVQSGNVVAEFSYGSSGIPPATVFHSLAATGTAKLG